MPFQLILGQSDYSRGFSIALAGLAIVFVALLLLSIFIATLPRLVDVIDRVWPENDHRHGPKNASATGISDDDEVIAAIGFVLHQRGGTERL